jgi:hypothetical protein
MVELLVAMVLIGIAATGFTLATLGLARGSKRLGWATTRNAALLAESNRLATTPFAALPTVTAAPPCRPPRTPSPTSAASSSPPSRRPSATSA